LIDIQERKRQPGVSCRPSCRGSVPWAGIVNNARVAESSFLFGVILPNATTVFFYHGQQDGLAVSEPTVLGPIDSPGVFATVPPAFSFDAPIYGRFTDMVSCLTADYSKRSAQCCLKF